MNLLTVLVALLFGLTFLIAPRNGGGWFWDFGNALGFLAFAGLLFQMIPPPRARAGRQHESLGNWVLGISLAHAFWFLVGDGTVRFYLLPGAPAHMWLGLAALVAMAVLAALARMPDRMRAHRRFRTFRRVHRALSYLTLGAAMLHIVLSGFYLFWWPQIALLALLAAAACLGRPARIRPDEAVRSWDRAYLAAGAAGIGAFVLIRNLGQ